jgi:hypothetical protein
MFTLPDFTFNEYCLSAYRQKHSSSVDDSNLDFGVLSIYFRMGYLTRSEGVCSETLRINFSSNLNAFFIA